MEPTGMWVQRGTPLLLAWQKLLQVFQKEKGTRSLLPGTSYGDEKENVAISSLLSDKFFSDRKGCLNSQQQKDDPSQKWGKNTIQEMAVFSELGVQKMFSSVTSLYCCSFSLLNLPPRTITINSNTIFNDRAKGPSPCPHPTEQGDDLIMKPSSGVKDRHRTVYQ